MKVLLVSEFTGLGATGYSTYYKEIAKALHKEGLEVVELASYGDNNNPAHVHYQRTCPWKIILNQPKVNSLAEQEAYRQRESSNGDAKFGAWAFEKIVAQEQPDIVIAIRDHWYDKFIVDSPASTYYTTILSPTVDCSHQKGDWLDTFGRADILTAYTEWSEKWLRTQYSAHNLVGAISPSVENYKRMDRASCRKELGLPPTAKIVGTVMRNQSRKKFPQLFEALSRCPDLHLYAHTAYPDRGWDIPTLLLRYGIANRTFLTYMCPECPHYGAHLYSTRSPICPKCGSKMETPSPRLSLPVDKMLKVYNSMDLYVQFANSEGFGIPLLEAAKCGIQTISVDYSAPEDIIRKTKGIPVRVLHDDTEIGSSCKRAIPDIDHLVEILSDPQTFNYDSDEILRETNLHYSWEATTKKWIDLIKSVKPKNRWNDPPQVKQAVEFSQIEKLSNSDFLINCVLRVAHEPRLMGSYMHTDLLDGLNAGTMLANPQEGLVVRINKKWVYDRFHVILQKRNQWEGQRKSIRETFQKGQKERADQLQSQS